MDRLHASPNVGCIVPASKHVEMDANDLGILPSGIKVSSVKGRRRYRAPAAARNRFLRSAQEIVVDRSVGPTQFVTGRRALTVSFQVGSKSPLR
jgi:hypothetical protein